jgi:uncharacterized protein YdcH (DUF465 family)
MTILAQIKRNPVRRVDYAEIERETNRNKRLVRDRIDSERKKAAARAELKKLKAQNARFDEILAQINSLKATYDGILEKYQSVVDKVDSGHERLAKTYQESGFDLDVRLQGFEENRKKFSKEVKSQLKNLDSTEKYAQLTSFLSKSLDGISKMLSNIPTEVKIPKVYLSKIEDNLEILLDDNTKEWVFDIERGSDGLITRVKAWQTM